MIICCCLIGVEFNWVAIEGTTEATVFALEDTIIFGEAPVVAAVGAVTFFRRRFIIDVHGLLGVADLLDSELDSSDFQDIPLLDFIVLNSSTKN